MKTIFEIGMDTKINGSEVIVQFQAGFTDEIVSDMIPDDEMNKIGDLITEITSIISKCIGGSEPISGSTYTLTEEEIEIYNTWTERQKEMFKDAPIELKEEIMAMEKELMGKTDEEKLDIMLGKVAGELKKMMRK